MDTVSHYAAKLVPNYFKTLPCHMDFEGQKKAEMIFQIIITFFGVVGFVWGYICQQFSQTFYIVVAGFLLSCLLTLPPWPMYRKHPLKWRPVKTTDEASDGDKSNNKQKKKKTN